ncbi:hypothetical protein SLEP1_g28239 [Rubroshorea leprosula]|uniref:Uncharacterized protein n=1 Tax=Rubroshorea leprosula TaxID=152421 RepID=A0AAV5K2S2_9ROSI|nr:hypothetical protein SLEP1_g28239 [Rubroshorea leprosula]
MFSMNQAGGSCSRGATRINKQQQNVGAGGVGGERPPGSATDLEGMWIQRGIELFEEDPEYQAKLKQFQKWHPPTFRGTQDTKDANEWIQDLEQIFKVITEQGGKGKAFINHIQPQNKRVEQKGKRKGVFINKVEAPEFKVCHQKLENKNGLVPDEEVNEATDGAAAVAAVGKRTGISRDRKKIAVGEFIAGDGGDRDAGIGRGGDWRCWSWEWGEIRDEQYSFFFLVKFIY